MVAAGLAAGATALVGGLTVAGAVTLYNSTDGNDAAPTIPEVQFPYTPTGLLAVLDDDGQLASMAVMVLRPGNGPGGNIVPVPVSADASNGEGPERLPIAETVALDGPEAIRDEVELTLGITLDSVEVVDEAGLATLLGPVGEVEVEVPIDVTDADGDVVVEQGGATLAPVDMAAVLAARDPDVPAVEQAAAANAVWAAIATTVGDGVGTPTPVATGAQLPVPPDDIAVLLDQVLAGPVGTYALHTLPTDDDGTLDVAQLDRVELAMLFAQIAPARVSAPNQNLAVQIRVTYSEEQLASRGLTNSDVAYEAVAQMVFLRANVISVDITPGEAPTATQVALIDTSLSTEGAEEVLGPIEVVVAEQRTVGVDSVITLGTDYLEFLDANRASTTTTAPTETTEPSDTTGTTEGSASDGTDAPTTSGTDTDTDTTEVTDGTDG